MLANATLALQAPRTSLYNLFGKRTLYLGIAFLALPLLLPFMFVVGLAIWCTGAVPIFGHRRVGQDGKVFNCWKFQTMVPNADNLLAEFLSTDKEAAREWAQRQKLEHDPRVTPLGKFLRATSLDELAQIWNVPVGEMNLVGPRPITGDQTDMYGPAQIANRMVRLGVTGSWQVSKWRGRHFATSVHMDAEYLRHSSLLYDLRILLATIAVVCRKTGQ